MIGIASDDLLLASVLLFSLLTLWDSLNQSVVTEKIEKQRDIVEHPQKVKQPTKLIEKPVEKKSKNESVKEKKPVAIKASGETSDGVTSTPVVAAKKKKELPFLPGCEPDGAAAKEMMTKYPDVDIEDIVRYLVARKGNVKDASEMLEKVKVWRAKHFPLKRADMKPAIETGCMFAHGHAKDKSPVIYFRGGLYDVEKATAETYVLGAAQAIDVALQDAETINVTVIVCTGNIAGGVNAAADMNFIKAFVGVLSDNYPERLKRLILFPFPWWARTIWSMVKVFVDKRTQDKVILLSGDMDAGAPAPKELFEYVDPNEVPKSCGGTDTRQLFDLLSTIPE